MSSEGSITTSTSSKLRQFGLYRSIDARTEEFLKLSRKRQLRQGCACAVVSTLITVTVVVSVLLIYEYGINSTWRPNRLNGSGWFGLMNNTTSMEFEEKFAKSNTNFDRTTLKLLSIIIKALKQNRHLEKIIEDSPGNKYEGKPVTEFTFKRNIFSDLRSIKPPSSRLYATAYKSSPIAFTRNVTKSQNDYLKLRKIKEYQRIVDYIHKMINKKEGHSNNHPLENYDYFKPTEKDTMKLQKPSTNYNRNQTIVKLNNHKANQTKLTYFKQSKNKSILKNEIGTKSTKDILFRNETAKKQKNTTICTCPSELGSTLQLLNKLQASVQQLLSDAKSNQLSQPCLDTRQKNLPNNEPEQASKAPFTMTNRNIKTIIIPYIPFIQSTRQKTLNVIDKVLVHHSKEDMLMNKNLSESSNISPALKQNVQTENSVHNFTNTNISQLFTILSMMKAPLEEKYKYSSTTHELDSTTTRKNFIQFTELKESPKKALLKNYMMFPVMESDLKNSAPMNWPLFKPNSIYKNTIQLNTISKPTSSITTGNSYNKNDLIMKYLKDDVKLLDVEYLSKVSSQTSVKVMNKTDNKIFNDSVGFKIQNMAPKVVDILDTTLEENTSLNRNTERYSEITDMASLERENTISNYYNSEHYKDRTLEDNNYTITPEDDFYDDTTPMPTLNMTKIHQSFRFEENNGIQSMLPQNRPIYLKIQRSDWEHKKLSDYDTIK